MSIFDIFKRKSKAKKEDDFKNTFLEFVGKYTSIQSTIKTFNSDIKKGCSGLFMNEWACSLFLAPGAHYAIRFKDDMSGGEFQDVFHFLEKELGEPDFFTEYDGYVWKKEKYYLTFGLVALNYNYEVPMICLCRNVSVLFERIAYKRYCLIADAITNALKRWGVDTQKNGFYKINYSQDFGFGDIVQFDDRMVIVHYKGTKLSISVTPLRPVGEFQSMEYKKTMKKEVCQIAESDIEMALEKLLEETKEYHGLTRTDFK